MKFDKFSIVALPRLVESYCSCGSRLKEVDDGFFSVALFCESCENVYKIRMIKVAPSKVSSDWLKAAKAQTLRQSKKYCCGCKRSVPGDAKQCCYCGCISFAEKQK